MCAAAESQPMGSLLNGLYLNSGVLVGCTRTKPGCHKPFLQKLVILAILTKSFADDFADFVFCRLRHRSGNGVHSMAQLERTGKTERLETLRMAYRAVLPWQRCWGAGVCGPDGPIVLSLCFQALGNA